MVDHTDRIQSKGVQGRVADAPSGHWVYRALPRGFWPYAQLARWDRPIGWWLLLWPCWWSAALASAADQAATTWQQALPDLYHLALFLIGAIAMRGMGCTYNDLVDHEIDAKVERTRSRPLPSGQVSRNAAKLFLALQGLVGLAVLLQFNLFSIVLGFGSLIVVAIYPFMKRVTDWPQLVLGLAFSWGALMGWAAHYGALGLAPVLLYAAAVTWTIGYDTIYAHQDTEDDALVGVRSTALLFGDNTKTWLRIFYGVTIALLLAAAAAAQVHLAAFVGIGLAALHLEYQIRVLDIKEPEQCLRLFKANSQVGWIVFAGFVVAGLAGLYQA